MALPGRDFLEAIRFECTIWISQMWLVGSLAIEKLISESRHPPADGDVRYLATNPHESRIKRGGVVEVVRKGVATCESDESYP
jgi:hypothetical protein